MRDIEKLSISKAVKEAALKQARNNIAPGFYEVDTLVRVNGSMTVNEDEKYIPTAEIPIKATLALFIRYCGITREAAKTALVRSMTEALNNGETGDDKTMTILAALEEATIIDDCSRQVIELTAQLPEKTRKGKVITNLECTVLNLG